MVPDRRSYGALPAPGVTGAGSNAVPNASLRVTSPAASSKEAMDLPNASTARWYRFATGFSVSMMCSCSSPTELSGARSEKDA